MAVERMWGCANERLDYRCDSRARSPWSSGFGGGLVVLEVTPFQPAASGPSRGGDEEPSAVSSGGATPVADAATPKLFRSPVWNLPLLPPKI
jgi:hypothetical protein